MLGLRETGRGGWAVRHCLSAVLPLLFLPQNSDFPRGPSTGIRLVSEAPLRPTVAESRNTAECTAECTAVCTEGSQPPLVGQLAS